MAVATGYLSPEQPLHAPADPNGIALDSRDGTLVIADGQRGSFVRIGRDRQPHVVAIETDGVISSNPIGGMTATPDGTLFMTRYGYGRSGAVVRVGADGSSSALTTLSAELLRYGIAYDAQTRMLYATQYRRTSTGPTEGAIVEIDPTTGHTQVLVVGLVQPVGIAKLGSVFIVTDARTHAVYRIDLRDGRAEACVALAALERPGAVCALGRDSVLVASYDDVSHRGSIYELWLDGRMRRFASGPWQPRGIATDGERVFVAVRGLGRLLELAVDPTLVTRPAF